MTKCQIRGCRYLQTTCVTCGRLVCEKILPEVQEWIDPNLKMPVDEQEIIVCMKDKSCTSAYFLKKYPTWKNSNLIYQENGVCFSESEASYASWDCVAYWMPLPKPPEAE